MDGAHTIEESYRATSRAQHALFTELHDQRVELEATLLKPNMVLSGYDCPLQAGNEQVAELTLRCLRHNVPAALPGVVFLSGGQPDEAATARLNAMNLLGPHPWELSFSFARALQAPPLKAWAGVDENVPAAQELFLERAMLNGLARQGRYSPELEHAGTV
jgi:fructose-bisphosphate aldolase class I